MEIKVRQITFKILKYLAPFGDKAGRYIFTASTCNELIDFCSQGLGIQITEEMRSRIEQQLKVAWANIIAQREGCVHSSSSVLSSPSEE